MDQFIHLFLFIEYFCASTILIPSPGEYMTPNFWLVVPRSLQIYLFHSRLHRWIDPTGADLVLKKRYVQVLLKMRP